MKKILLLTALFAVSVTTVAQKRIAVSAAPVSTRSTGDFKPTEGTITAEVGLSGGLFNFKFRRSLRSFCHSCYNHFESQVVIRFAITSKQFPQKDAKHVNCV